jgi:hypothetical protein
MGYTSRLEGARSCNRPCDITVIGDLPADPRAALGHDSSFGITCSRGAGAFIPVGEPTEIEWKADVHRYRPENA